MHLGVAQSLRRLADVQNTDPTDGQTVVWSSALAKWVPTDIGTQAELDTHTALTTSAHGGIVASSDARLSVQAAGTASVRTIGTGATEAAAGNDARLTQFSYSAEYVFSGNFPPHFTSNVAPAINTEYANRIEVPRAGTISDFIILIGSTSSGNIDAAIQTFDGTTYTRAWSKGSTACPPANTWTSLGNPGITVTRGQIIFPTLAFDNTTVIVARLLSLGSAGWHGITGMTYPKFSWSKATSFPIPATTADSGVTTGAQVFAFGFKLT